MGFFDFFSRKTYEDYENAGDDYLSKDVLGAAKIEYEKSLKILQKKSDGQEAVLERIQGKINQVKEKLALQHKQAADDFLAGGMVDDAEDLLRLALELTSDPKLEEQLRAALAEIDTPSVGGQDYHLADTMHAHEPSDDEYFDLLLHVLPEEEQILYQDLNHDFKQGYVALNQADFRGAVAHFQRALADDSDSTGYIRLEMATALLNDGQLVEAREIAESVRAAHADKPRVYQVLCEINWEEEAHDQALQLLEAAPDSVKDTLVLSLLKGETLFRAQRFEEAREFYDHCGQAFEWDELLARNQAKNYESLGLFKEACDVYAQIMGACQGCGDRIDPVVKKGYANACLEIGHNLSPAMEMFFELTREDPDNRGDYLEKISRIYEKQGETEAAQEYRRLADQVD